MTSRQEVKGKHACNNSLNHQPTDLANSFCTFKWASKNKRKHGAKAASQCIGNKFKLVLEAAKGKYGLNVGSVKAGSLKTFVEQLPDLLQSSQRGSD